METKFNLIFSNDKKKTDNIQYLNKKRSSDFNNLNIKGFNKFLEQIKNKNDSNETRKLEFKLSHILHGENTTIQVQKKNIDEFISDDYVDSLLKWKKIEKVGPGLYNLGNTCFLNSVLQSLFYTTALRNYISSSNHLNICKFKGVCFICEYCKLVKSFDNSNAITPKSIIQNIKIISKNIRIGRQEDAHEFLLYMLDSFEKSFKQFKLSSTKHFINNSDEDNLIQKIFGGKMISSVTCLKCKKSSNKIDNYLDLSLVN